MKRINSRIITQKVAQALAGANLNLPPEIKKFFQKKSRGSKNKKEKTLWQLLLKNAEIAAREKLPLCQDTGTVIAFVKLGSQVIIENGTLEKDINDGVKTAYQKNYFRKSVVNHPFKRKNTGTNTPATIHIESVPGHKIEISLLIKGAGAENQSVVKMWPPGAEISEIKKFILETVKNGGPFACPPLIIGIGLGGTIDTVGILAKKALLKNLGKPNPDTQIARLEKELLAEINKLNIGLFGLKIGPTVLGVQIETAPCHLASLPVAVNFQCHAVRKIQIVI